MIENMCSKMKTVYVAMCADLIHNGHLNIINTAKHIDSEFFPPPLSPSLIPPSTPLSIKSLKK